MPEALVYDFDLFNDAGLIADPHVRALEIATMAPPVFWTPRQGGHWVFAGYEANFEAGRDWESFTSEFVPPAQMAAMKAALPPGAPHIPSAVPICLDPPLHGAFRLPLNGAFSPKAIAALRDEARALARRLVADVAARGRCELMSEVAEPLPVEVFLRMLGLPIEGLPEYRALVREHMSDFDADPKVSIRKLQKVAAAMRQTFEERRAQPRNDLISLLWGTQIDGRATTMDDLENYGVLLFIAGLDTVMQGIGFGIRHLAGDPDLQARLRVDPGLISEAVEELLRRYSFTVPPRKVAKDLVFQGAQMKAGERVDLFLPAANLDARRFPHADRVDIDREDKVHIAFGTGPHRCLGSHLARFELQILYEELLAGLPPFRLDPERSSRFHGGHTIGIDELHLVWDV